MDPKPFVSPPAPIPNVQPPLPISAVQQKKSSPVRRLIIFAFLAIAVFVWLTKDKGSSFSGKPTETTGRMVLENKIEKQSKGVISLVSFKKINAKEGEVFGQKLYEMEYEAEIAFSRGGAWVKGDGMEGAGFEFRNEKYNNNSLIASFDGAINVSSTDRKKFRGRLTFEKTENGWKGEDGSIF